MGNSLEQWRSIIGSWGRRHLHNSSLVENMSCNLLYFRFAVLAALLVIGGVEINPGPSKETAGAKPEDKVDVVKALQNKLRLAENRAEYARQKADQEKKIREDTEKKLLQIVHNMSCAPQAGNNHGLEKSEVATLTQKLALVEKNAEREQLRADLETDWRKECEMELQQLFLKKQQEPPDPQLTQQHRSNSTANKTAVPTEHLYKKQSGFADMSGELYEVGVNTMLFCRAVNTGRDFYLASNMEAAASFDDIVLKLGHRTVFIQLKHRKAKWKLNKTQLFQLNGSFSLLKYCSSYCQNKKIWSDNGDLQFCGSFEDALFVIYTNAKNSEVSGNNGGNTEWQRVLNSGGSYFYFDENTHPDIYEMFDNISRYKQLLTQALDHQLTSKDDEELLLKVIRQLLSNSYNTLPSEKDLRKLLKDLESLGDLSGYREFLSHLWFFTGQASENHVKKIIEPEIRNALGTTDTENIYKYFHSKIQDWWRKSNAYLTETSRLWQDIVMSRITDINRQTLTQFDMPDICFSEDELNSMKAKLAPAGKLLHIVSKYTAFSCLKIHQSLADVGHLLVNSNTMQQARQSEILALWGRWCDILVVVGESNVDLDNLADGVCDWTVKRLVLITKPEVVLSPQYYFSTLNDNIGFMQLDKTSQDRLLSLPVLFQGHDVPLGEVISSAQNLEDLLPINTIIQLKNKVNLGNCLVGDINDYEHLSLQLADQVGSEILSHSTDVPVTLALSGLSQTALKQLEEEHDIRKHEVNCQIKIIKNEEDFLNVTGSHNNVHWLHYETNTFTWRQSRGDMEVIKEYSFDDITSYKNVDSAMDVPHRLVLLSAGPGAGKSTLLNHLAIHTKQAHPATWVICINLNKFSQELSKLPRNLKMSHVIKFLLKVSGITTGFEPLFRNKLESMENVCVLVDGFDEISPIHAEKVTLLLQLLQATRLKKLWVTTRPTMREKLEQKLSTLSFSLQSFSEKDQKSFLSKFWKRSMPDINETWLNKFSDELLLLMQRSLRDTDKQFTGIPLQSLLLAEAFEGHLRMYIQRGEIRLPERLNLLDLFNRFLERKFDIYCEKYNVDRTKAGILQDHNKLKKIVKHNHMIAALLALLPRKDAESMYIKCSSNHSILDAKKYLKNIEDECEKMGIIVEISNGIPVFIHRTFAELFMAHWFSKYHKKITHYMDKLLGSEFHIVRHFLDRILCQEIPLHTAVMNHDKNSVENLLILRKDNFFNVRDEGGRTALFAAVLNYADTDDYSNVGHIFNALLQHGADINIADEVFCWTPLFLAVKLEAWYAVGLLLQKHVEHRDLIILKENIHNNKYVEKALKVATRHGFVELVSLMMEYGVRVNITLSEGYARKYMLHNAAQYGHLGLVKFLLHKGAYIEIWENIQHRTALMLAAEEGRVDVVKYLIEHGANTEAKDCLGNTALLRAAECGKLDVVKLFLRLHSHTVTEDKQGNNILSCAAISDNAELVAFLLDHKLKINYYNAKRQTPLWLASRYGNLSVTLLLLQRGANLRLCDSDRCTPLHIAAMWGHLQVVKCLVEHGANICTRDKKGHTPVERARKYKRSDVIEYLTSFTQDRQPRMTAIPYNRSATGFTNP